MSCKLPNRRIFFTALSLLVSPFVFLYASEVIWTQSLTAPFSWIFTHSAAAWFFWLLATLLFLALYGFFRRMYAAYMPVSFVCLFFPFVSHYKFSVTGAPLQLSDFSMVKTLGQVNSYASSQFRFSFASIVAIVLANLFLFLLYRVERHWTPIPAPGGFLLGGVCLVLCLSALWPGPLQTSAVKLDGTCLDQQDRNQQVGMMLGLYTAWAQRQAIQPDQMEPDVAQLAAQFQEDAAAPSEDPAPLDESPDIIYILSESFFDITRLPNITFSQDPVPVFHALSQTCTNGLCLSNTFGGGTGYVEMENFTGLTSSFLREGDTLSTLPSAVYDTLPSTVRQLRDLGYSTTAVHAYNASLYNRAVIYPAIGFDKVCFSEDFPDDAAKKGPYLSDDAFADMLISQYQNRDTDAPCFLYGLSMENHQGYTADKFDQPSGITIQSDRLSAEDKAITDSLVTGLHDADASLGKLVDYFSTVDRPVMLVFVGDHLPSPNLADGESLYARLGYCSSNSSADWQGEELQNMLSTNYLIWTNYGAPQDDHTESCTFLGLDALKTAGVELGSYFTWLDQNTASQLLMDRARLYVGRDGSLLPQAPEASWLDTYRDVERALLYGASAQDAQEAAQ